MTTNYGIDDIETLSFKDGVRKRISMYLGSADMNGVYGAIQEIISNSIDEFYMGYGETIEISLGPDNMVVVTDKGRGIPFGIKEDGSNVLVDIFSRPHTGGKFSDKIYQGVAGLNGIGAKATCLSSSKFNVSVVRDGKHAMASFEKGNLIRYKEEDWEDKTAHGTSIQFAPDPEVYNLEPIEIDFNVLCEKCKNLSYLTKGLTFELTNINGEKIIYCAKNGLVDLIKETVENPVHSTPISYFLKDGHIEVEIALQWTKDKEKSFVFTNGLHNTEGGTPLTGIKTAITRRINKIVKGTLNGDMARTGLVYAISCKVPNPSFSNQTKTKVNNPELRGLTDKAFSDGFEKFSNLYPNDLNKIKEFLEKEQKAEVAADKARQAVYNAQKEIQTAGKKKYIASNKLKDAEYLGENSTLLIVEGNSAAAAMAVGRDVEKYGILGLRGKVINCLSNPIEDILENEEVKLFLIALGIDINNYNPKKLRYGKVAIAVDADDDGSHIGCLVMALVHRLCPQFLEEGRLYWLKAPSYKVSKGKQVAYYFTDEELSKGIKGEQIKFKGLGQMSEEDTKESMFNPSFQRIEKIEWSEEGIETLVDLMGDDVEPRKEFVFNHIDFEKYGELI